MHAKVKDTALNIDLTYSCFQSIEKAKMHASHFSIWLFQGMLRWKFDFQNYHIH